MANSFENNVSLDRLPPQNIEAEKCLLKMLAWLFAFG